MAAVYVGIDKMIKTIGKLNLKKDDLLIFRTSDEVTFEALDQARDDIKKKLRWDGFIVALRNGDDLTTMSEHKQRELYELLKNKYGEK